MPVDGRPWFQRVCPRSGLQQSAVCGADARRPVMTITCRGVSAESGRRPARCDRAAAAWRARICGAVRAAQRRFRRAAPATLAAALPYCGYGRAIAASGASRWCWMPSSGRLAGAVVPGRPGAVYGSGLQRANLVVYLLNWCAFSSGCCDGSRRHARSERRGMPWSAVPHMDHTLPIRHITAQRIRWACR